MTPDYLWIVVLACCLATFVWRGLGVVVARRIDANGAVFRWITCVSYAMVAGVLAGGLSLSALVALLP
jgi:branched-subunit amino acid transport protein